MGGLLLTLGDGGVESTDLSLEGPPIYQSAISASIRTPADLILQPPLFDQTDMAKIAIVVLRQSGRMKYGRWRLIGLRVIAKRVCEKQGLCVGCDS